MMHRKYFFDQPVKNNLRLIAIDSSKLQVLDTDLKAIQQINFPGNLARDPISNIIFCFNI